QRGDSLNHGDAGRPAIAGGGGGDTARAGDTVHPQRLDAVLRGLVHGVLGRRGSGSDHQPIDPAPHRFPVLIATVLHALVGVPVSREDAGWRRARVARYTVWTRWVWGGRDAHGTATRLLARNAAAAWLMLCMAPPLCFLSVVVFGVDRQVQREDAGQNQHVVLAGGDLDRIARGHGQPAFGDGRDGLAVPLDREFVA